MADCDHCEGDDGLAYSCQYCNGTFCSDHRLPENHNCIGLTDAVSVGKRFESGFDDTIRSDDSDPQIERTTEKTVSDTGTKNFFCKDCGALISTNSGVCNNCGSDSVAREGTVNRDTFPSSPDVNPDGSIQSSATEKSDKRTGHRSRNTLQWKTLRTTLLSSLSLPVGYALTTLRSRRARKLVVVTLLVVVGAAQVGYISAPGFPVDTEPLESDIDDAVSGLSQVNSSSDGLNQSKIEMHVHAYINEERTKRGLQPLRSDQALRQIASSHSEDMANRQYYSHTSPDGEDFADRYAEAGYSCRVSTGSNRYMTGAENIAYTYAFTEVRTDSGGTVYHTNESEIAGGLVNQWMNSEGHRKNILRPYWENEGIGIAIDEIDGKIRIYATQNFC